MTDVRLNHGDDVTVNIDDTLQGHLLRDAMFDFGQGYTRLTNLAHMLCADYGGPSDKPVAAPVPNRALSEDHSLDMHYFAWCALEQLAAMAEALNRAKLFATGEVYDTLIDETLLGPKVSANGRRSVYTETATNGPVTHVYERRTGLQVYMGLNDDDGLNQPFVAIPADGLRDRFVTANGEPILAVSLVDVDLYDNEGEGDRVGKGERQERIARFERVEHHPDTPDGLSYRWVVEVVMPWVKDEDGLPRIENGHGETVEAALLMAQEIADKFRAAGYVKPGEWPKGD